MGSKDADMSPFEAVRSLFEGTMPPSSLGDQASPAARGQAPPPRASLVRPARRSAAAARP
jgi:hypothetical protein